MENYFDILMHLKPEKKLFYNLALKFSFKFILMILNEPFLR
jgi:hypothetical protein